MAILFVSGVNDLSTITVEAGANGTISHVLDGNCSILGRVPFKKDAAGFLVLFGKGVKQPEVKFEKLPSLVFNQIANADTHRGSLERCAELSQQVAIPVLNRPENVLQTMRDTVSEKLQGIPGVVMPRTIRIQPHSPQDVFQAAAAAEMDFPFIVRLAAEYDGEGKVLIQSEHDQNRLNVFPLDGRDFYLTEYVECGEDDGRYHRQIIAVIDGEPVLRHALFNKQWNVDGSSRSFMLTRETWAEYKTRIQWFETDVLPALASPIQEISKQLSLEYYCIDCNVRPDGTMVVFEASANPDTLHIQHREESERMKLIHQKIHGMLARHSGEVVI